MKKVFITAFLFCLFITSVFSQDARKDAARAHNDAVYANEGLFLKRIENNLFNGDFNLSGKGDVEKRFFGDFNARVEFFDEGPYRIEPSGFRILMRDSSCILEVKYISNYTEIREMIERKSARTSSKSDKIRKISEEQVNLYEVATCSVPVSNYFAEELYQKMISFIVNYGATEYVDSDFVGHKDKGIVYRKTPIFSGGTPITFRTVIKAELWSLRVSQTWGDARKMEELCREIIKDVRTNTFAESKYLTVLNAFEN